MSKFEIFIFCLCFVAPFINAHSHIPPSLLPKVTDVVDPFFKVTPDGQVIFNDFVLKVDSKVNASLQPDPQTGVSTKDITISPATGVKARLFLPKITNSAQKLPILLFFHGGGFVTGSAFFSKDDYFHKKVASQAKALTILVEYRLWPDYPLPTAYEDGFCALQWLASKKKKAELDDWVAQYGDFKRVFVGGDSAGGNIAHNIVMRAGKEGLPNKLKITGLFLGMPYFFGSTPVGSEPADIVFSNIAKLWRYVCPLCIGDVDSPWLNPFAPGALSLSQLKCKKLMVYAGTKDKELYSRTRWYAKEVTKHGYSGEVKYYEGDGPHVFYILEGDANPATKVVVQRLASFIKHNNVKLNRH